MAKRSSGPQSQVVQLFLSLAEALGMDSDKAVAQLADVVPVNVANWRSGSVSSFKTQTLEAIKLNLNAQIDGLQRRAEFASRSGGAKLHPLVIEEGAGPDELLRQFRDRITFDYAGHRFLYYEPQGALAWLSLIQSGYDQSAWLRGTLAAARAWLDPATGRGGTKGPIAAALRHGTRGGRARGLDLVGLGVGDGAKEVAVLRAMLDATPQLDWLTFVPVDVSIPLLLRAGSAGRSAIGSSAGEIGGGGGLVTPTCADFEEGPLAFLSQLRTARPSGDRGLRLILLLGNIFGNLRDEDSFVRERLWRMARPGDLVWVEVATMMDPITSDPLYSMTNRQRAETSAEANRRLLLQGPFRRWEAAMGRRPSSVDMRVWVRHDDDAARVPGSYNFCHDLLIEEGTRVCTMLYSRRYDVKTLCAWFEQREFACERVHTVRDSKGRSRVSHMLLRRL